jgi:hypothetical protein
MDPHLHLALLEGSFESQLRSDLIRVPAWERRGRYDDLMAEPVSAKTEKAVWTDDATLWPAAPDGADRTIRDLTGLGAYPRIRCLYLAESTVDDLGEVSALPNLALVWLRVTATAGLRPLLACDGLMRVNVEGVDGSLTTAQREVLTTLADRGVKVDQLLPDPATLTAPFADPMLKLAVLEALQVELPEMQFFDEYEFDDANLTRLLAIEVSQEQLDSIEELDWFGEGEIEFSVFSQFDGESDEFNIRSLEGIEALRNLRTVQIEPLDELPADQIAALQAKGVTVTRR